MAADVYARKPHAGRGGWTWYTGSASWMYKLIIESFLGLQQEGDKLKLVPCIPKKWDSFKIHYRYKNTMYHIEVVQKNNNGEKKEEQTITLADDGFEHNVQIII